MITQHNYTNNNPYIFHSTGDLGQTKDSVKTVEHAMDSHPDMVLHAGDLSYANCDMPKWDSYAKMVEPLASRVPWMVRT